MSASGQRVRPILLPRNPRQSGAGAIDRCRPPVHPRRWLATLMGLFLGARLMLQYGAPNLQMAMGRADLCR